MRFRRMLTKSTDWQTDERPARQGAGACEKGVLHGNLWDLNIDKNDLPYSMLVENEMYRSFASLRMTAKRNRVILSEAKDLYESNLSNILKIPQFFVMSRKRELTRS